MPRHFTEEEFNKIKRMQAAGVSQKLAADLIGRSQTGVGRVFKATALEDLKGQLKKQPAQQELPVDPTTMILQNINDALIEINERLLWLTENTAVPSSRKFS